MQTSCLLYIGRTQTTRFNTASTRRAACLLKGIRTWISTDSFPTFEQASPGDIQPQTVWAPLSTKTLSPCMFTQAIYFFSHRKTKDLISLQSQGPKIIAKMRARHHVLILPEVVSVPDHPGFINSCHSFFHYPLIMWPRDKLSDTKEDVPVPLKYPQRQSKSLYKKMFVVLVCRFEQWKSILQNASFTFWQHPFWSQHLKIGATCPHRWITKCLTWQSLTCQSLT